MANQKQRIVGGTNLPVGNPAVVENLPRQNVDRENAVVGAQGGGMIHPIRDRIVETEIF